MTELQKTILNKVNKLSDKDIQILLVIIDRLLPKEDSLVPSSQKKLKALSNLQASVRKVRNYFPEDFNPEEEYREAMSIKYGNTN